MEFLKFLYIFQTLDFNDMTTNFSKQQFCKNFAVEWVKELTQRAIHESSVSVDKHDPENLPTINIRSGKNRQYNDGKIYNLDR